MLCVTAWHAGDEDQMIRLADWLVELGPQKGHTLLLVHDKNAKRAGDIKTTLSPIFDAVITIKITDDAWNQWPESPNLMFRRVAKHIEFTMPQPWLWLEPDAIPLRAEWMDALQAEYRSLPKGKVFLGDHVVVANTVPHMSGVAVYPPSVTTYAGRTLIAHEVAFDVVGAPQILPLMQKSALIFHQWKRAPFERWEEFENEILSVKPETSSSCFVRI